MTIEALEAELKEAEEVCYLAFSSSLASFSPASRASIVISVVRLRTVMIVLNFGEQVEYMCPRRFLSA